MHLGLCVVHTMLVYDYVVYSTSRHIPCVGIIVIQERIGYSHNYVVQYVYCMCMSP